MSEAAESLFHDIEVVYNLSSLSHLLLMNAFEAVTENGSVAAKAREVAILREGTEVGAVLVTRSDEERWLLMWESDPEIESKKRLQVELLTGDPMTQMLFEVSREPRLFCTVEGKTLTTSWGSLQEFLGDVQARDYFLSLARQFSRAA